jgi:hypothetical protein
MLPQQEFARAVDHAINLMTVAIQFIVVLVVELLAIVDLYLGKWMTAAGVGPQMQLFIMLFVSVLILIAALRTVGPVLSTLVLILLVLLLLHRVIPSMDGNFTLPGALQALPNAIQN